MSCYFNGCTNPAMSNTSKCRFHSYRGRCTVDNCYNQVYARNVCVRHGAKRECSVEGCSSRSRVANYCSLHGPPDSRRRCSHEDCTNLAHLRGKCFRHGGGHFCKVDGCVTYARKQGLCARHAPKSPQGSAPVEIVEYSTRDEWLQRALIDVEPIMEPSTSTSRDVSSQCWSEMLDLLAEMQVSNLNE